MGFWSPRAPDFGWTYSSAEGETLSTVAGVTAVLGGSANAKGNWVRLVTSANAARDVFGLYVIATNTQGSGKATLMDIGTDPAGGTSYTALIPNMGMAGTGLLTGFSCGFWFPVWIKAGSSIAARLQAESSAITYQVAINLYGAPRDRRFARAGTKVTAYGVDTSTTKGTSVTAGTGSSKGSWTLLASNIQEKNWFWNVGFTSANTTGGTYAIDLAVGDASNKMVVIANQLAQFNLNVNQYSVARQIGMKMNAIGDNLYARLAAGDATAGTTTVAAWGVSG